MAQLHPAPGASEHRHAQRSQAYSRANRSAIGARRFPSRARVRRRPEADRAPLLHELRGAAVHSRGSAGGGGLRTVPAAVSTGIQPVIVTLSEAKGTMLDMAP